jgi:hypothetical protein
MPPCFSDRMPAGSYQCCSGGYSVARLSALSQYETASSRSERNVGCETGDTESMTAGIDFAISKNVDTAAYRQLTVQR